MMRGPRSSFVTRLMRLSTNGHAEGGFLVTALSALVPYITRQTLLERAMLPIAMIRRAQLEIAVSISSGDVQVWNEDSLY